ncbi:hypothetical protein D3C72_768680 [compost metagenome]
MHGAVVDDHAVAGQQVAMGLHHLADGGRALLLLAVQDHLDIDRGLGACRLHRIDGRQQHHDRPLVVRRGTTEDPPLRVHRPREQVGHVDLLPIALGALLLQHRRPRTLLRPLGGDDRLAIQVHIEQDGLARRLLARILGEQHRLAVVVQRLGRESTLAECLLEPGHIAPDIFGRHRIIGDAEQIQILAVARLRLLLGGFGCQGCRVCHGAE